MSLARSFSAALCLAVTVAFAEACALNPVSGRPELVLVTTQGEKRIGAEESQKVEDAAGVVDTPSLAGWVRDIGQRLAAFSPRRDVTYTFHVLDTDEPNAFALPGGYVYVTRGLLSLINTEDELACILGHEIGHVAARHSAQQLTREAPFAVVTNLGAAVTGVVSDSLSRVVSGVGGLASGAILAPFSRDQEREADRVGQELAAKAGYDPAALSRILASLEREESLHARSGGGADFLASHPSTPERVLNTTEYARKLQRAPGEPFAWTRALVLARLTGMVVGPAASKGVVLGATFLHADFGTALHLPDGYDVSPAKDSVMAVAHDRNAAIVASRVAAGDDPFAGARELARVSGAPVVEQTKAIRVGAIAAASLRAQTRVNGDGVVLAITWLAFGGYIHEIVGIAPVSRADSFFGEYDATVQSFHGLTAAERASIHELRLRVAEAHEGETPATFARRLSSAWTPEVLAIANEVGADAPLLEGAPLKLAVTEPYVAEPR